MNKLVTYLLLCLFCANTFGSGAAGFVHYAAHALQGTHTHWHTHHTELHHPHTHEHEAVVSLLLEVFDTESSARVFKQLSLLMMGLNALLSYSSLKLSPPVALQHKAVATMVHCKSPGNDVPTPPPRYLS